MHLLETNIVINHQHQQMTEIEECGKCKRKRKCRVQDDLDGAALMERSRLLTVWRSPALLNHVRDRRGSWSGNSVWSFSPVKWIKKWCEIRYWKIKRKKQFYRIKLCTIHNRKLHTRSHPKKRYLIRVSIPSPPLQHLLFLVTFFSFSLSEWHVHFSISQF